jgi:hypothetical protein
MTEWGELSFKVVRLEKAEIELRQGSRVICSSKRDPN